MHSNDITLQRFDIHHRYDGTGVRFETDFNAISKHHLHLPVRMRAVKSSDVEPLAKLFSAPGVGTHYANGKQFTFDEAKAHMQKRVDSWLARLEGTPPNPYVCYPVFTLKDGTESDCIGYITLGYGYDKKQNHYYLSFGTMLHPSLWNQGYGSYLFEVATHNLLPELLKNYPTINHKPINRISFTTDLQNEAGTHVALKAGFLPKINENHLVEFDNQTFERTKITYEVPLEREKLIDSIGKEPTTIGELRHKNTGDLLATALKHNQKITHMKKDGIVDFINKCADFSLKNNSKKESWRKKSLQQVSKSLGLATRENEAAPARSAL